MGQTDDVAELSCRMNVRLLRGDIGLTCDGNGATSEQVTAWGCRRPSRGTRATVSSCRRVVKKKHKKNYRPQLSKSRVRTATWARLAASATRVKSLRKASVEGFFISEGGGAGTEAIWLGDVRSDDGAAEEPA